MSDQVDTSGFYNNNNGFLYAPNFIDSPTCSLNRNEKDTYNYPIDGWYWFNTVEEAAKFFGIEWPPPVPPEPETNTILYYGDNLNGGNI